MRPLPSCLRGPIVLRGSSPDERSFPSLRVLAHKRMLDLKGQTVSFFDLVLLEKALPQYDSRRECSIDILVEPTGVRAGVRPDDSVGINGATLLHVGTVVVGVTTFAGIDSGDRVAIVGPRAKGEVAEGGDPQVVAVEGDCAIVELLPVRVAGEVSEACGIRPCSAEVIRLGGEDIERRVDSSAGVVADGTRS